ncbi:hypothetical protein ACPPVU_09715 [Mucilaginibacter sp. McL0603]|uniref:hypothetical protein n=1 Tax=Mucilaginibacter sp. McL0603 TaxID=3415670 RepID=UPI003CF0F25C
MIQQISIFSRSHSVMIILMAFVITLILAYFYAEFILTVINFLTLKMSVHGVTH